MRIAVVSPYDLSAFGGVQDQVVSLVAWLQEQGMAVTDYSEIPGSLVMRLYIDRRVQHQVHAMPVVNVD